MDFINNHGEGLALELTDHLGNYAELLNCRDDDVFAGFEVFSELRRGAINGIHHAFDPFHLFDPLLKLPIQHAPIGDDDDRVKDAFGVRWRAVQVCEQVR